jgi:hypothetical protein
MGKYARKQSFNICPTSTAVRHIGLIRIGALEFGQRGHTLMLIYPFQVVATRPEHGTR